MNQMRQVNVEMESEISKKPVSHSASSLSRIYSGLSWIKNFFDYLGGSREKPPGGASFFASSWWLGLWWGLLIGLILLFCGQTSKFIYIDF